MPKYRRKIKESIRLSVIRRCDAMCEQCKTSYMRDIHHIDENTDNNSLENLMGLCSPCHRAIHWGIRPTDFTGTRPDMRYKSRIIPDGLRRRTRV